MAGKKRFGIKDIKLAIEGSGGNKTEIARRLKCTRQTVENYLERFPELVRALAKEDDLMVEIAESNVLQMLVAGNEKITMFVLETRGKARGWSKRTEITGADGGALQLSNKTMMALAQQGIELGDIVKHFESMILDMVDNVD